MATGLKAGRRREEEAHPARPQLKRAVNRLKSDKFAVLWNLKVERECASLGTRLCKSEKGISKERRRC